MTIPSPLPGLTLDAPRIMGIVNVTPDSFSDGGQFDSLQAAVDRAGEMRDQGADIIDIGGESTRPGAAEVGLAQEIDRTAPVIEACKKAGIGALSIDTRKAGVMAEAIRLGADLVNDVSALTFDRESLPLVARTGTPVVLMHAQGTPKDMQTSPAYGNVVAEIGAFLQARIDACTAAGLPRSKLIVDPGIGFGKTLAHNLRILANLDAFLALGCPVLLGASRKSFIAKLDGSPADKRLGGSLAAVAQGCAAGIHLFRVHDVQATRQFLTTLQAVRNCAKRRENRSVDP